MSSFDEKFNLPKRKTMDDYKQIESDKKFQYRPGSAAKIGYMIWLRNRRNWIAFEELWSFLTLEEQEKVEIELNPVQKSKRQKTDISTYFNSIEKTISELKETFENPLMNDNITNELMKDESDFKKRISNIQLELSHFKHIMTKGSK